MPVGKIEKVVGTLVEKRAERDANGMYICHAFGMNVDPVPFSSLDEVADYLRRNPKSGVRMNPGWSKISRSILIDGLPR